MKQNKKIIYIILLFILTMVNTTLLIRNTYNFYEAYYNFDLGKNMQYLECKFETSLTDKSLNGEEKYFEELIIKGGSGLHKEFFSFGYNVFVFTITFLSLLFVCISINKKDKSAFKKQKRIKW